MARRRGRVAVEASNNRTPSFVIPRWIEPIIKSDDGDIGNQPQTEQ